MKAGYRIEAISLATTERIAVESDEQCLITWMAGRCMKEEDVGKQTEAADNGDKLTFCK